MTDQIGRVLGSRYRLKAPIGTGSSAQVFLADDVRLHRLVAVKVLHPALAEDQTFLRRFRAEAQASAKLNHSNIVKLYDSGNDEGPYLVTEFVDGGSLRALLDLGHRLTVAQAVDVGLGAARGLDFAHRQGFVHRDIKPANLLFGLQDGRLRIADFGVARALAEAAWTEPSGAVLGTARYASPEQANGQAASGKSDVYSLALVLVEAVTGDVPFATDTTLSTLRARVDTDLTVGAELGPLAEVLEWAGRSDPDERPDAAQFRDALAELAEDLDPAEPLPLAGAFPAVEQQPFVDPDPTHLPAEGDDVVVLADEAPAAAAGAAGLGALVGRARSAFEGRGQKDAGSGGPGPDGDAAADADASAADPAGAATDEASDAVGDGPSDAEAGVGAGTGTTLLVSTGAGRSVDEAAPAPPVRTAAPASGDHTDGGAPPARTAGRRRWSTPVVVVVAVVAVMALVAGALAVRELLRPQHEVPQLAGLDVSELRDLVEGQGWDVERVQVRQDGTREGEIVAQDPAAGEQLREGHTLTVTVSRGAELVPVPGNLGGLTQGEATAALEAVGLRPGAVSEKWGELVPAGIVLGASLLYDEVPAGSAVPLVLSKGPRPRAVPEGMAGAGLTYDEVAARLSEVQLVAVRGQDYSDTVPEGQVIGTSPAGGTLVPRDSEVVVIVSRGPQPVIIPDVSGDSVAEAQATLEARGLVVDGVEGPPNGVVTGTDPAAGLQVDRGATVVLLTQRRGAASSSD